MGPAECRATLSDRMNAGGETTPNRDHVRPRQWGVPMVLLLDGDVPGAVVLQEATDDGQLPARVRVQARDLSAAVAEREAARPRWVWDDT